MLTDALHRDSLICTLQQPLTIHCRKREKLAWCGTTGNMATFLKQRLIKKPYHQGQAVHIAMTD
jgi:hypothetical protein